jgi:organic radical activating enzyme
MEKVSAINLKKSESMLVTWDIGRRCNFDCSYCESTRHNTYSPPTAYENLIQTFDFIKKYTDLYNRTVNLSFTGGEPTVNPRFWDLVNHVKTNSNIEVSLTSNGTWHEKHHQFILDNFVGVTVSWHTEGPTVSKQRAIKNAVELHRAGLWTTVNVMLHTDRWQESVDTYCYLKEQGVKAYPVMIGDGVQERTDWFEDTEGVLRRTSHSYTPEQIEWFWKEKGISKETSDKILSGTNVGRGCCGGRCLTGKVGNEWKPVSLVDNHFKDWFCKVNYYFLHIEEHTRNVFHHQTCQATFTGRGPIGSLDNTESILADVERYLADPKPIICPNERCGCGTCVPKAKEYVDYLLLT